MADKDLNEIIQALVDALNNKLSSQKTTRPLSKEGKETASLASELEYDKMQDFIKNQERWSEQIKRNTRIAEESAKETIDSEQIINDLKEERIRQITEEFRQNQLILLQLRKKLDDAQKASVQDQKAIDDLIKKIKLMEDETKEQAKLLEGHKKEEKLKEGILNIGKEILNNSLKYGQELEKHIIEISRLNGGYDKYKESLREANNLMYGASVGTGLRIEELNKAFQGLSANFIGLTTQSIDSQKVMGLAVAQLGKLGVDAATASKSFDSLVAAMGKTPQQAEKIQTSFVQMAAKNRLALGSVTQAFAENSSRFVGYGEQMTKVLDGLAEQSLKTGIAMNKLVGIAQQFDTFEGAAKAVGNLNALLGGDYFNSIELLTATDDERIKLLKDGVAASGMQWESMNRFQKMAIANAAGISDLNEASKLFGQTSLQNTRQQAEGAEVQKTLAEQAQSMTLATDKLKSSLNGLMLILEPIVTTFMKLINVISDIVQAANNKFGPIITSLFIGAIYVVGKLGLSVLSLGGVFRAFGSSLSGNLLRMKQWITQKELMNKVSPTPSPATTPSPTTTASAAGTSPAGATNGFLSNAGNMLKAAGAILLFAAALFVLAKALQEFSSKEITGEGIARAIGAVASLIGISYLMSKFTVSLTSGVIAIALIAGSLLLLGLSLKIFSGVDWKLVAGIGVIILGLGLAIAGFGMAVSGPQALLIAAGIGIIIGIAAALLVLGNSLEKISTSFKTLAELKNIGELSTNLIKFLDDLADTSVSPIQNLAEAIGLLAENLQKLASVSSSMSLNVSGNAKTVLTEQVNAAASAVTKTSEAASAAATNTSIQPLIPAQQTVTYVPLVVQIDKKTIVEILKSDIENIAGGVAANTLEAVGIVQSGFTVQNRLAAGSG
jgi:hypothetical protein